MKIWNTQKENIKPEKETKNPKWYQKPVRTTKRDWENYEQKQNTTSSRLWLQNGVWWKTFLPDTGRQRSRRWGGKSGKQTKKTLKPSRAQPKNWRHVDAHARACLDVRVHVTPRCATRRQNQKERTHGKRQNINRFLIVVIIFIFPKMTIFYHFDKIW